MAQSSGTTTTTQQPVGVNRRTLLRTGAHAAWAIPAVQIVTQSPALAATGPAALTLRLTEVGRTATTYRIRFDVTNNNTDDPTSVVVSLTGVGNPNTGNSQNSVDNAVVVGSGWARSGSTNNYAFTGDLGGSKSTRSSASFEVTITPKHSGRKLVLSATATPTPGAPGSAGLELPGLP
jgi:hypothetical protein